MYINEDHSGRSASGKFAWRSKIVYEEKDYHPDSNYWLGRAKAAKAALVKLIGGDSYLLWAEITWPNDTINQLTWEEIFRKTVEAISLGQEFLERWLDSCGCVLDQSCPVCRAQARLIYRRESNDV